MSGHWDARRVEQDYPIVGYVRYSQTVELVREDISGRLPNAPGAGADCTITHLSKKSLARLAFVSRETIVKFHTILTLTYPDVYPNDGKEAKKHLNRFLTWLRRVVYDLNYIWFLEFQTRGAPHYHILLSCHHNELLHHKIALEWSLIVSRETFRERRKVMAVHEHAKAFERIREPDGAARYALKYLSRAKQKIVPEQYQNVGRFWGASKEVKKSIPTPTMVKSEKSEIKALLHYERPELENWDVYPRYIFVGKDNA